MRDHDQWIVFDTETTGLRNPVFPVEIAAQRMNGWRSVGLPFRVLVNFDVPVEPTAQKMHGYSREYLREHGVLPGQAISMFLDYIGDSPLVAYNLSYDWNRVLAPTLDREGCCAVPAPGFCALNLTRRVVCGLPDYKLKTVIKLFGLAKDQTHRADEDVRLMVAFLANHLGPHLQKCHVCGIESVDACSQGAIIVEPLEAPAASKKSRKKATLDQNAVFAIGELVGICRMITLDNKFTADEINFLADWLERCPCSGVVPISDIFDTVREIVADGRVTREEQVCLTEAIDKLLTWRP